MSMTIIALQDDIYPYGCKGDVVTLTDDKLSALDAEVTKRKLRGAYNLVLTSQTVPASEEKVASKVEKPAVEKSK